MLTVVDGGSNDTYAIISSKERGRAIVDQREIFTIFYR